MGRKMKKRRRNEGEEEEMGRRKRIRNGEKMEENK
jgi:hypothetical protein